MPTAYSIAEFQYTRPAADESESDGSGLRYSCYAKDILRFLVHHRTALASHVQRSLPHLFRSERDARRHLRTLYRADEINIVRYNDPRKPNVYLITDKGIDHARDFLFVPGESFPSRRDDPKGDHILHELLITEVAVARAEFMRSRNDFQHLWERRFGFHEIPGFEEIVPDNAELFQGPYGCVLDFTEVLSGERSITRVQQKLEKYDAWQETQQARQFLLALKKAFGATRINYRIAILVHNRNLIGADRSWERRVLNATFTVTDELQKRIWTATNAALNRTETIDSPVWHCAAELLPYKQKWLELPKRKRLEHFTNKALPNIATHPFFTFPIDT